MYVLCIYLDKQVKNVTSADEIITKDKPLLNIIKYN